MNKYYGKVGFAVTEEVRPGVWKPTITERFYNGDILRNYSRRSEGQGANDNIVLNNQVSILADPYVLDNYSNMIFIEIQGTKWKVSTVEIKYPRLLVSLGGVYNDET